jgi:hypothetical protein
VILHKDNCYFSRLPKEEKSMKALFLLLSILSVTIFSQPASADDTCKDVLVDGAMQRLTLRSHSFFLQLLAVEYAKKSSEENDEQLSHDGSMEWAGITFGGKFNKNDVKKYLDEVRTKLDLTTLSNNESSAVLASGDPVVVQAWTSCMLRHGGLGMRFEAQSPTKAVLRIEWYAYPVASGVSTETKLKNDILIPPDVKVVQGNECLKKSNPLRDKIPCSVNLEFKSGADDLLLTANATLGTVTAYLPPRRILVAQREPWRPQPGELETVGVYAFADDTRSRSSCLSPKKDWSFVEATMEARANFISGNSSHSRCTAELKPLSTTYLCFNARMVPDVSGDNRCSATLVGEIIHWEAVDGLGIAAGKQRNEFSTFE